MKKNKSFVQIGMLVLLTAFLSSACFKISIINDVRNPEKHFRRARRELDRLERSRTDRHRHPRRIHILLFEKSDHRLVRASSPLWFVDACLDISGWEDENERFESRYDLSWRELRHCKDIGPGLLIEVDDEDTKLIVWLE
jgi:hypothetical protein